MTDKANDEIDLIELFIKTYLFFKKHFYHFLLIGFIGGIIGGSYGFFSKTKYESNFIGYTNIVSNEILIEQINNSIVKLHANNNTEALAKILNTTPEVIKSISKIETFIPENINPEEKDITRFGINIQLDKNKNFEIIKKNLYNSLITTEYLNKRYKIYIRQQNEKLTKLNSEINELDELQKDILNLSDSRAQVVVQTDKKSFHSELMNLFAQKQGIERAIELAEPITIIDNFTTISKVEKNSLKKSIIGAFTLFFLALFFFMFKNLNKLSEEK